MNRLHNEIDLKCAIAHAEIRLAVLRALDRVDALLGLAEPKAESHYRRSFGQTVRCLKAKHA